MSHEVGPLSPVPDDVIGLAVAWGLVSLALVAVLVAVVVVAVRRASTADRSAGQTIDEPLPRRGPTPQG